MANLVKDWRMHGAGDRLVRSRSTI